MIQEGSNRFIDEYGEIMIFNQTSHPYCPPTNGIYFCTLSEYKNLGTPILSYTVKNGLSKNLEFYELPNNKLKVNEIGGIDYSTMSGLGRKFTSKNEVYNFLSEFSGVKIPKDQSLKKKKMSL